MIQYIMINHGAGSSESWHEYIKMLCDGGHMIAGSALEHGMAVQAGTFTPIRSKTITGYIVIQAPDIETTKNIMLQSPVHQAGGMVELFPLVEGPSE